MPSTSNVRRSDNHLVSTMEPPRVKVTFHETDEAGNPTATFVYSEQGSDLKRVGRVDAIVSTYVAIQIEATSSTCMCESKSTLRSMTRSTWFISWQLWELHDTPDSYQ